MDPNDNISDTDLDTIAAGAEVDEEVVDDAENDEIAERERAAAEAGEKPQTREEILEDVRKSMADAGAVEESADDKTAREAEEAAAKDKQAPAKDDPAATPPEDAAAAEKAESERKASVDKEANDLHLKGKARDRFHELNRTNAEQGSQIKALNDLAGKDKEGKQLGVAEIKARIDQHEQFEDAIFASGITSDDFKNVSGYKFAINSDDPMAWENARQFLRNELDWLECDRMKLRPREGAENAYAAHEDLKTEVETGELSAKRANELAAERNVKAAAVDARKTTAETGGKDTVVRAAAEDCASYAESLQTQDAAMFTAKWPALKPKLADIQAKFPPEQWRDRMELEFLRIPYTPSTAAPVVLDRRPPIRPGALPRAGARRVPGQDAAHPLRRNNEEETPFDAMKRAMAEAGGAAVEED